MKLLIQRVSRASVEVEGSTIGEISRGLLVFVGFENLDKAEDVAKATQKLLKYRVFPDHEGKMNQSVVDINGGILLVSQFTLAANTRKGLRPSFSSAAEPTSAESLYNNLRTELEKSHSGKVAHGKFAADMKVSLLNDGPVTFLLEI